MTGLTSSAAYHVQTGYSRHGMSGGDLDWSNQPQPYKSYPGAPSVALPRELVLPKAPAGDILSGLAAGPKPVTLSALANLLFMADGFTSQAHHGEQLFLYRSAPSAGALYPVEVYLAARDVDGLEDGLYHYSIIDFALTRLRPGPPPAGLPAPALYLTSRHFRSAWKYRQRAFRYCLLDTGHVLENIALATAALGLEAGLSGDFDDMAVNAYLGLDPSHEAALAVVRLGALFAGSGGDAPTAGPVPEAAPLAAREETFDLIWQAVGLTAAPLLNPSSEPEAKRSGERIPLASVAPGDNRDGMTLVQALQQRRSRRNFRPRTIPFRQLSQLLKLLWPYQPGNMIQAGLVVNEIEDLSDGFYRISGPEPTLFRHKGGFISPRLGETALGQDWVGRANMILALSADLSALEQAYGPRSLRLAYLEAGRFGQRAYLAAEIMGWGCCGVGAFYDREVYEALSLPEGEEVLYLVPVGPYQKRTHGGRPTSG